MADKNIGSLPQATTLDDDALLVAEQQGQAVSVSGQLIKKYAAGGGAAPYIGENGNWFIGDEDTGVSATGPRGPQGPVFTPDVDDDGNLSWTNDGGLENPEPVNITGPQGLPGIYLGSGDMPEGYFVQLDPEGEADGSFEELVEQVAAALEEEEPGEGGTTTETDPTVPDWAKAAEKPSYTAEEVGAIPTPTTATVGQYLRVLSVDDEGKVTEVEAVDMASGGGGSSSYKVIADAKVTIEEGVTVFEIDLDGTDKYTDWAFYFFLSTSTLETECSGQIQMFIDGYNVGYFVFTGAKLLTNSFSALGFGDTVSKILVSVVSTVKLTSNNMHSKMMKAFGGFARESNYVGKAVWVFPAEYAGEITYQIYAR